MRLGFRMWGFGEGIALRGLLRAATVTGEARYFSHVSTLLRGYAARGVTRSPAEHVAPGTELLLLAEATREPEFLTAARSLADLQASFPRNSGGARMHRPDLPGWSRQIWVDCMHVEPPFLLRLGCMTGEERYGRQGLDEIRAYGRLLQDPESGLFRHGYEENCGPNGQFWARGNGWALLGLVESAMLARKSPAREELEFRLRRLCTSLAALQTPEGLWHTVLNAPATYLESTLAVMVAYGLRVSFAAGLLSAAEFGEMERRARSAALQLIAADGSLERVTEATPVAQFEMYATRPFGVFPWGQGPLLLMLSQP